MRNTWRGRQKRKESVIDGERSVTKAKEKGGTGKDHRTHLSNEASLCYGAVTGGAGNIRNACFEDGHDYCLL